MSNIVYFPGKKPINLNHFITFEIDDWDIRFIPANYNQPIQYWKFENQFDAERVYKELLMQQCSRITSNKMDGHYYGL